MTDYKNDTKLVDGGRRKEWTSGIINTPVYRASTCTFSSFAELQASHAKAGGHELYYGRKGTPSQWSLEEALMDLEGPEAEGCMLYPSGASAVSGAILSVVKAGDHILITDSSYEPTRYLATSFLKDLGVSTTFYDPMIGGDIQGLMQENTTCVIVEAPGSLTFEVQDVPAIAKAAHNSGAKVIMDNTWATALNYQALEKGVDIVVHAATKYIVGHSDVMMGAAIASKDCYPNLQKSAFTLGLTSSPDDCFLALRGLRTMGVRMRQHEENSIKVASTIDMEAFAYI